MCVSPEISWFCFERSAARGEVPAQFVHEVQGIANDKEVERVVGPTLM